jgi:hypothetical protein
MPHVETFENQMGGPEFLILEGSQCLGEGSSARDFSGSARTSAIA